MIVPAFLIEATFLFANILFLSPKIIILGGNVMEKILIYEKPTCTTCRQTVKILTELGVDFERVNYYIKPFSKSKLKTLLSKMKMNPSELLRKNEKAYKELKVKENNFSEERILEFMLENPDLIQRPIVEIGSKAVLARPVEKIREFL